jgi:hypothetical protein
MPLGSVNITLRPLRLAFLVDPADTSGVMEAIELNTFLWGGMFNPIVPVYRRTPKKWQSKFERTTAREVSEGLIRAFDPDYVVLTGKYLNLTINVGHRDVIKAADVLGKVEEDGTPSYGIGLFEVLSHFIQKEMRFVRRTPLDFRIPSFTGSGSLFLASVFGRLPAVCQKIFDKQFVAAVDAKRPSCKISEYTQLLEPEILFLRRLGALYLEPRASGFLRDDCVFLLDASHPPDILEYWNLRAVGRHVIPIPIQATRSAQVRGFVEKFIEENFRPLRRNKDFYNTTTLIKSRSLTETQLFDFGKSLTIKPSGVENWGKISLQRWYPRIWDEWAWDKDGSEPADIVAETRTIDFSDQDQISFRTLDPKFAFYSIHGTARFANVVDLKTYGGDGLGAEVIPEGDRNLVRTLGAYDLDGWRFSRKGPVYLSHYLDWSVHLGVPGAEQVFVAWLRSRGWNATLSPPGLLAKQLLKQFKGVWGTSLLADNGIVQLLDEMQGDKTLLLDALLGKLAKIANESRHKTDAGKLLNHLVTDGVVRLGIEVQCPICTQRSWYSVTESDYRLQCRKCNEHFDLPTFSPKEIKWSYRTVGPFSLPGRAYGVYTVLLTYRFFSMLLHEPATAIMSFGAEKASVQIEADLGLFVKEVHYGQTTIETVFAECKTYDYFRQVDVKRMATLAKDFPGAIVVFATLRKELSEAEKKLLRSFVNRGRKYWKAERPYNPVLILTGTELFADFRPEYSWKEGSPAHVAMAQKMRGHMSLLELCDATQQLYLDMKPWHEWLRDRWDLKRAKAAQKTAMPSVSASTP